MDKVINLEKESLPGFAEELMKVCGADVRPCVQCKKCSAGCPVSFAMDILPHRIIHMVQLGLKEDVLTSSTIWVCASCETCTTRCPNDVDIAGVMDGLRQMALREGKARTEKSVRVFQEEFLKSLEKFGRVHELGLVGVFKLRTGRLFEDMRVGLNAIKKGKMSVLPHKSGGAEKVREIFKKLHSGKRGSSG